MVRNPIPVTLGQLKSPLAPAAAVFYTLSALFGLAGVALLFDGQYAALLVQDRIDGGIQQGSSLVVWNGIDTVITLLCFLCPAILAAGIWTVLRGRITSGMKIITTLFQVALWLVNGSAILALGLYVFGMLRNALYYLQFNAGVYYVYSMVVSEGLMGVQAFLLYRLIHKFLQEGSDCCLSITYTLSSGKLDSAPIPSFPALGLALLGCVELVLCWDKMFTLKLVENYVGNYYTLLIAAHPGQYLAAATLITGAVGNFLLSAYLRRYNRTCERLRFQASRKNIG